MKSLASDVGQICCLDDQGLAGIAGVHDLQCFGPKMTKEDSTVYNLKVCIHNKPRLLRSGHTRKPKPHPVYTGPDNFFRVSVLGKGSLKSFRRRERLRVRNFFKSK